MPSIILKKYSEPESLTRDDLNQPDSIAPLSYADWVQRNFGLASDDSERQYQQYLLGWYGNKKENLNSNSVRDDYVNLLKRISFVFRDDAEFRKFSNIDFDDAVQLKLAVPQYVKKLKEIALYYRDKRESVRKAKLKYNMIGSLNSIERTFYEYILKAFSKRDYILNVPEQSAWNAFPDLSSINTGFSIEVEELYDDTDYFDPRADDTYSYDVSSSNPLFFVLNDILEDLWNVDNAQDVPLSGLQYPMISEDCIDDYTISLESLQLANEKYIGADKQWLTGGFYEEDFYDIELNFNEGNNFFYWFSGEYLREAPHTNFQALSVNELDWIGSGATAGKEYSASDVIFVDNDGTIEGAWLASFSNITVEDSMVANIRDNKTFKYPYPSIGVSAEGLEWTGKEVQEITKFEKTFFPNQTVQKLVKDNLRTLYWTDSDSVSTVRPLPIHSTSLIHDGAFASKRFHLADKIITRPDTDDGVHDSTPDELFSNDLNVEWLYDFSKTQLAIDKTLNKIYWPIQTYENPDDINIRYNEGESLNLNEIDSGSYVGAIAGTDIDSSDIIYKKISQCADPTEAAWLKGTPLSSFNGCVTTSVSSEVVTTQTQNLQITTAAWTPATIPTIVAWFADEDVVPTADGVRLDGWLDRVKYSEFSRVRGRPDYNAQTNEVILSNRDILRWSSSVSQTFTVGVVFKPTEVGVNQVVTWARNNKKHAGFSIECNLNLDGNVAIRSGSEFVLGGVGADTGGWVYAVVAVSPTSLRVIVGDGAENRDERNGRGIPVSNITHFDVGNGVNAGPDRPLNGSVRDFIVCNGFTTVDEQNQLADYLETLAQSSTNRPTVEVEDIREQFNIYNIVTNVTKEARLNSGDFLEGAIQAGVMFKSDPDKYTRFIWTGEGEQSFKQSLNHSNYKGFQGFKHDAACPYTQISKENRISLLDNSKTNNQWERCECGAIQYSPMGHTGNTFRGLGVDLGDFIIMDTSFPKFKALADWVGGDGKPWTISEDFAWFKLDAGQIDGSVGWGKGKWVTNGGKDFKIKPGNAYKYFRSGLQSNCELSNSGEVGPFFIGKHQNCGCTYMDCECVIQNCQPVWMKAELVDGIWIDTGQESEMTLESGKYYDYNHRSEQPFSIVNSEGTADRDCLDSTNFIFGVNIPDAGPYWAKGTYEKERNNKFKGLMYSGESLDIKLDYLYTNQPLPSDLVMVDDMYMRYERNTECTSACFVWDQPLTWDIDFEKTSWNTLEIDECVKSDIQHFIINSDCQSCKQLNERCPSCCSQLDACGCVIDECLTTKTGLTATNKESTMLLRTSYDLKPVFTNYFAINPYTMDVRVVDTTLGLPPSGGRWVPEHKEIFVEAKTPWNNLASLYDPLIADKLSTNLYSKKDAGFFTPDKVGYTTLILRDKKIEIHDTSIRSASSVNVVIDNDHYARGPYAVTYTDSTWMKRKGQCVGGEIRGASEYQEFVPYQTSFESLLRNDYGIQQQSDLQSPWTGDRKDEFNDERFPENIKGERAVYCGPNSWYNNQPLIEGTMYQWKSDVYGNQYGLYKTSACNIWERESSGGDLWVRDLLGNVATSEQLLSSVIDTYRNTSTVIDPITSGEILDFDVQYDTFIMQLPDHVIFERLNMDFDNGHIYSIADQSCIFDVTSAQYAGTWLNESNKVVTFGWFKDGLPTIQQLALDKSKFNTLFDENSNTDMWDATFDSTERPQLTYNAERNIYNMTFMATSGSQDMLVVSNFEFEDTYSLESTTVKIIPLDSLSNKKLIKTVAYDDKLLMVFEQQTCPNQVFQVVIDN
jgi:hypothetical protein|tara:strand:+ start:22936 stop:28287 length:5352 start_codon:yes stop_codon:yes gene_type:complete